MGNCFYKKYKKDIFKKYDDKELFKDIENFKYGKGKLYKVLNHFFEEIIYKCSNKRGGKSPFEVLQDDDTILKIFEYIKSKPNFYTGTFIQNLKSFFRNGGKIAQKVANFDPQNAKNIYFRYNGINGRKLNILDTSMGFGSRLSAVILSGHNYIGFDPNKELFNKLVEYKYWLKNNGYIDKNQSCNLLCKGSEIFDSRLVDKIDVMFTSPPYFDLETYSQDKGQSIIMFNKYDLWLDKFAKPTIENIYKYLKIGGYAMINIKNMTNGKKYNLFDDWFEIFSNIKGFEFVEIFEIKHQSKRNVVMNTNYSKEQYKGFKEPVMVFKKIF